MTLESDIKNGDRTAIAKAITMIENNPQDASKLLKTIHTPNNSMIVGITGSAGSGKSTIINRLALQFKKSKLKPAVLAIDPTSHITGGAILGDRVRMQSSTDDGTFIRSLASRGATGATSSSIQNCIRVLGFAKFNPIIIESVGAGQTEVAISNISDIVVVVFNPNTGDSIQTIKAGITEIGDIYLVNKAELSGATRLYDAIRDHIGSLDSESIILKVSAKTGTGMTKLKKSIEQVFKKTQSNRKQVYVNRLETELRDIVLNNARQSLDSMLNSDDTYKYYLDKVLKHKIDPYNAAQKITKKLVR